jgi:AcrR family transcriptional regulator
MIQGLGTFFAAAFNGDYLMPKQTFLDLSEEKRGRILKTAIEEFAANPYDAASISNIVRNADIAKGSFYQYFSDKKDLYQYLIEFANAEKAQMMKGLPAPDPDTDLFGYFHWLFQSTVYFEIQFPLLARIQYRAFVEEVPFPEMVEELRRRGTTQFFKQLLSQGILQGRVSPFIDPDMGAFLLESAYYRFGPYFINRLNINRETVDIPTLFQSVEAQEMINNLLDIFKSGMQRE